MRHICLYFQVHQPFRLRIYRFFDIGQSHDYYHELNNRVLMQRIAKKCYLPMNALLKKLITRHTPERFSVAFSISGMALEQMQLYAPEVLESFQDLHATGGVELIAETYAHSLASLKSEAEFRRQVAHHAQTLDKLFGARPTTFRNTELVFFDALAEWVADMGYTAILAEGADTLLGWRSPNYLYTAKASPKLRVLLRNYRFSDDVAFRFSNQGWPEWPLTAEKFARWLRDLPSHEMLVNLFMDYETFGEHQWPETGIFEFFEAWVDEMLKDRDVRFVMPHVALTDHEPVGEVQAPKPLSWADSERDLTAWLGNDMQQDAFDSLYALEPLIQKLPPDKHPDLLRDWLRLQTSDHFYYMCTKFFADGDVHKYFNPYDSPYEAYVTYMNVLADFRERLEKAQPA